jgi:hypothetical protein
MPPSRERSWDSIKPGLPFADRRALLIEADMYLLLEGRQTEWSNTFTAECSKSWQKP